MDIIPVVDFDPYRLGIGDVTDENLRELGEELKKAFCEVGFVYLKNTGIDQKEVNEVLDVSKKFFMLPENKKSAFKRGSCAIHRNHGWISVGAESLNPRRPHDLKEAFNTSSLRTDIEWPSDVDGFRDIHTSFFLRCKELSLRVLRVMALSLDLEPNVFLKEHERIGSETNGSTLRSLYYPPVKNEHVKDGQIRCGEHSDYGSITLVFQGHEGGLQVLNRNGEYISAPSIPGTVLINIADLMQRWTSDVFVSAVHRVLLPPAGDSSARQSLAFFVQPDDDVIITCCDGSDKYPAVNAGDYLMARFKDTYS
ncbi:uncharacterized protein LOC143486125 [Brachyhypopomus gauderio]|uniref:uncharacterized protein LOC143486125 n=1 Tax=Brachyhypopomus gauderio TaxID=698409 RepID=UPI00404330CC